ncbi:MAG TPA: DUF3826 domain-containing protein [Chitinophagaceae bacterium]|jgi:hypothetical protein
MKRLACTAFFIAALFCTTTRAQSLTPAEDPAYTRTITERSGKIVATLGLPDSTAFYRIRAIVTDQYRNLNNIYSARDAQKKAVRADSTLDKSVAAQKLKAIDSITTLRTGKLHGEYLAKLGKELNPVQVDKVKDGMTYSVLEITYKAYQEELPNLTEAQKAQLLAWLTEAREYAMDAESSEKKHAWFGKYKGRINNYLSANGYDMKKAGEEWEKRRKAAKGG